MAVTMLPHVVQSRIDWQLTVRRLTTPLTGSFGWFMPESELLMV